MRLLIIFVIFAAGCFGGVLADSNFEDNRCRCVCPSTMYFAGEATKKHNDESDNHRRYYTHSSVDPINCNPQSVVKHEVEDVVDGAHIDAFLANCDCRFENRNTLMIKIVVFFVLFTLLVLISYMAYLMCFDPMIRKKRLQMPYRQQRDEIYMEDNIFTNNTNSEASIVPSPSESEVNVHSTNMRSRSHVLGKVEAEQNKWMKKVEAQRKEVFEDHSMLN